MSGAGRGIPRGARRRAGLALALATVAALAGSPAAVEAQPPARPPAVAATSAAPGTPATSPGARGAATGTPEGRPLDLPLGVMPGQAPRRTSTFDDYRRRVDAAYDAAAKALPAGWKDVRATQDLAAQLNTLLPGTERVQVDGVVVVTDNSILRSFVARLDDDSATEAQRRETMRDVTRHLGSLKLAVDEAAAPTQDRPDVLRQLLARTEISSRPTLADLIARQIERLSTWLQDWFARVFQKQGATTAGDIVLGIVLVSLAAMLVTVVVYVVRNLSAMLARHDERYLAEIAGTPIVPAAEGLPADAFAFAEELAADGRFREATRALFGGAARALVEFGLLRSTRTRTNAELLADLGPVAPPVLPALSSLSGRFERAWYGHADPGAEGYAAARDEYGESMRAARLASRSPAEEGEAS